MKKPAQSTRQYAANLLQQEIARLTNAFEILTGDVAEHYSRRRRPMSMAARRAIAKAQRKRWALRKKAS